MSDLPYIERNNEVQIVGQDSIGNQVNYVTADVNGNMFVKDYSDGPVSPGTAASSSSLIGGVFNTTPPALTNTQQAALQLDSAGRLLVDANVTFPYDTNYGVVGATTLRTASEIGNATGGANFGAGATGAQTLRVAANTYDGSGNAISSTSGALNVFATQGTSPWVTSDLADGSVNGGTAGTKSLLGGGIYNSTPLILTNGQQASLQLNSSGYLLVAPPTLVSPATQNITVQDTASTTTVVANGQNFITGTPTAGSAASFVLSNEYAVIVQVTGTWTGTLQVEISMDGGTTWSPNSVPQDGTNYILNAFTGNFTGRANTVGYTNFRLRATTAITGTAIVRITEAVGPSTVYINNPIKLTDNAGDIAVITAAGYLQVKDNSDGPVTPGAVAGFSSLAGGQYNSTPPTLTTGQQAALQLDSAGRLLVDAAITFPYDTNYGTVGATTLRTASQIGNATGAANFGAGATSAQTLRVAANTYDGSGNAITSSAINTQQALFVRQAAPGLDLNGTGTLTALNSTVIANTQGCSMVTFWIAGTFVLTYLWEGTVDGTNWDSIEAYNITFGYVQGSNNAPNEMYSVACGGFQEVRMRAALYTSGTATINWNSSQGTNADHNIFADTNPISQSITTNDLATTSTTGANGQVIYTGTPTAGSVNSYSIESIETVTIEYTGTWTGTLQVEVSIDAGGSWTARPVYQIGIGRVQASFTQNFSGALNVAGCTNFRIRAISAMTGTATPVIVESNNVSSVYIAGPIQELKDVGRNVTNYFMATQIVTTATDTLQSLTGYKSNAAVGATTTPAVVTAGKTYRIISISMTYIAVTTAGTAQFTLRANTGGVAAIGSPAVAIWSIGGESATAGISQTQVISFPDGLEFAAGTGIGISMIGRGATGTAAAVGYGQLLINGYEY